MPLKEPRHGTKPNAQPLRAGQVFRAKDGESREIVWVEAHKSADHPSVKFRRGDGVELTMARQSFRVWINRTHATMAAE